MTELNPSKVYVFEFYSENSSGIIAFMLFSSKELAKEGAEFFFNETDLIWKQDDLGTELEQSYVTVTTSGFPFQYVLYIYPYIVDDFIAQKRNKMNGS